MCSSSPVAFTVISSIDESFFPKLFYEVLNITISIMSFNHQVKFDIHFRICCSWNSSSDMVSFTLYSFVFVIL